MNALVDQDSRIDASAHPRALVGPRLARPEQLGHEWVLNDHVDHVIAERRVERDEVDSPRESVDGPDAGPTERESFKALDQPTFERGHARRHPHHADSA